MRKTLRPALLLLAVSVSAALPLAASFRPNVASQEPDFPGWPLAYDGRALTPLPMSEREEAFARDFPGRIGRFSDGSREIVLRYVASATRRLHPASDCYRGLGFTIEPRPLRRNARGQAMGCFEARKGEQTYLVCEGISAGEQTSWPDVSEWYWDAMLGRSDGPWWSVVVAQSLAPAPVLPDL